MKQSSSSERNLVGAPNATGSLAATLTPTFEANEYFFTSWGFSARREENNSLVGMIDVGYPEHIEPGTYEVGRAPGSEYYASFTYYQVPFVLDKGTLVVDKYERGLSITGTLELLAVNGLRASASFDIRK